MNRDHINHSLVELLVNINKSKDNTHSWIFVKIDHDRDMTVTYSKNLTQFELSTIADSLHREISLDHYSTDVLI